jgi:glutathione S-transferase
MSVWFFPSLALHPTRRSSRMRCPRSKTRFAVAERQLGHGENFLLGSELTIADFYLLPATFAFSLTAEGQSMYPKFPAFCRWRERMDNLPAKGARRRHAPADRTRP